MPRDARQCASCGERTTGGWRPRRFRRPPGPERSPGLAAALAVIFPGAGHFYCERFAAGLMIMFVAPVALVVVSVGALVFTGGLAIIPVYMAAVALWIWQVFDAHASASVPPPGRRGPWRPRGRR